MVLNQQVEQNEVGCQVLVFREPFFFTRSSNGSKSAGGGFQGSYKLCQLQAGDDASVGARSINLQHFLGLDNYLTDLHLFHPGIQNPSQPLATIPDRLQR